jgi:hypothetical protein
MSNDPLIGDWPEGESRTVDIELRPCPFCHHRPIATYIPPHTHGISKLPPFLGAFYIECSHCEVMMMGDEMLDLQSKWNDRPYDLAVACRVEVMKEPKPPE